jgi:HipA-like protein
MAQVPASILSVLLDQTCVGSLYNTHPLAFCHDNSWLALPDARPIDPQIPLGPERIATPYVHAFFENLLPEGEQRKLISLRSYPAGWGDAKWRARHPAPNSARQDAPECDVAATAKICRISGRTRDQRQAPCRNSSNR